MNPAGPIFFAYLAAMLWLLHRRTQWLTRFGIFTTLLGALLLRYGLAVPFSDAVNPSFTGIAIKPERLLDFYIAVVMVYAGIYAGVLLVDFFWTDRQASTTGTASPTLFLSVVAGLITLVVLIAWVIIPWNDFTKGILSFLPGHTAATYREHRVLYGNDTLYSKSAIAYVGSFTRYALAPVALWILYFHRKRSTVLAAMFWILLGLLFVIGLLSGQKLPALLLMVGFAFAVLIERGRPSILNWRLAAAAIALVVIIAPALYLVQYPTLGYGPSLQLAVFRLTEEYSRVAQLRFIFYPDIHPFLSGMSSYVLRGLAGLVGLHGGTVQSPETYIPAQFPSAGANPGTWNAGFFADAWADFGFLGVAVSSVAIGAIVRAIDRWYSQSGQGLVDMGVYAAVCVSAIWVSDVGTLTALWTYGLGSAFLLYALFKLPHTTRRSVLAAAPIGTP